MGAWRWNARRARWGHGIALYLPNSKVWGMDQDKECRTGQRCADDQRGSRADGNQDEENSERHPCHPGEGEGQMPDLSLCFVHAVILPSSPQAVNVNALFFF